MKATHSLKQLLAHVSRSEQNATVRCLDTDDVKEFIQAVRTAHRRTLKARLNGATLPVGVVSGYITGGAVCNSYKWPGEASWIEAWVSTVTGCLCYNAYRGTAKTGAHGQARLTHVGIAVPADATPEQRKILGAQPSRKTVQLLNG